MTTEYCPVCDHEFLGQGFSGIDAHWKANHADLMDYDEAWLLIKNRRFPRQEDIGKKPFYSAGRPLNVDFCRTGSKGDQVAQAMIIAGVNRGVARGALSLKPGPDRRVSSVPWTFTVGTQIPAMVVFSDIGFDEVTVYVAYWPTPDAADWIKCPRAGARAGEAFACGWLERSTGPYLMSGGNRLYCARHRVNDVLANAEHPRGFVEHGPLIC